MTELLFPGRDRSKQNHHLMICDKALQRDTMQRFSSSLDKKQGRNGVFYKRKNMPALNEKSITLLYLQLSSNFLETLCNGLHHDCVPVCNFVLYAETERSRQENISERKNKPALNDGPFKVIRNRMIPKYLSVLYKTP